MKIIFSNLLKALQNKTKSRDVVFLLSIGFLLIGADIIIVYLMHVKLLQFCLLGYV